MTRNADYWNEYYASEHDHQKIPSQFAAFVAQEFINQADLIIDLGSGDGRDSIFFKGCGFNVIAVDNSDQAVRSIGASRQIETLVADVTDLSVMEPLIRSFSTAGSRLLIYARFVLHTLTNDQLERLFDLFAVSLTQEDRVALEFRTPEDDGLPKKTGKHFRRGVSPAWVLVEMGRRGFNCSYFREGFGFAKYEKDDAHVARVILVKQ
jgi:hypothetical protein